jgi:hypothetical protein
MSAWVATFTFSEPVLPEPVINFLLVTSSASVVSSVPLQDDFYFWNTQTDETTWDIEARGPGLAYVDSTPIIALDGPIFMDLSSQSEPILLLGFKTTTLV